MSRNIKFLVVSIVILIICLTIIALQEKIVDIFLRRNIYGPLNYQQVLDISPLPIHIANKDSKFEYLQEVYYFYDYHPELTLRTYFISKDKNNKKIHVAKMLTYNIKSRLTPQEKTGKTVIINWSPPQIADVCNVLADANRGDELPGLPYKTCFSWVDEKYQYLLYTTWPEDESLDFVNSLVQLKPNMN